MAKSRGASPRATRARAPVGVAGGGSGAGLLLRCLYRLELVKVLYVETEVINIDKNIPARTTDVVGWLRRN
jgi:hypothetical protein